MDGSPDFRPEPAHHASDPSFEEMLRRARDARLGNGADSAGNHPQTAPAWSSPVHNRSVSKLWGWLLFAAGVLVGVLLSVTVADVTATVSRWTAVVAPATPPASATTLPATPTSIPTPLPTVTPTATPFPTATAAAGAPPTTDEIVTLVQDFYDNQGPYAGSYVLLDVTNLQVQSQDETQLTACISYEAATVDAPDTAVANNTRLFTLEANNDGSWQVVAMGESGSCSIS